MGQSSERIEEIRRRMKKERKGEKKRKKRGGGERERESTEMSRAVSRLALLHNFIALSPVFAAQRKKKRGGREEGMKGCFIISPARNFCEQDR